MLLVQRMDSDPFSANATSQLSSDFRSAVSTSPLEHRLHHKSRLDRAHSESLTSMMSCALMIKIVKEPEACMHACGAESRFYLRLHHGTAGFAVGACAMLCLPTQQLCSFNTSCISCLPEDFGLILECTVARCCASGISPSQLCGLSVCQ